MPSFLFKLFDNHVNKGDCSHLTYEKNEAERDE